MLPNEIPGQQLEVHVGGTLRKDIYCSRVHRSVGGQRIMEAQCEFVLAEVNQTPTETAGRGDLLHDLTLRDDLPRQAVTVYHRNERGQREQIHWGHVVELQPVLSDREVKYAFVSRIVPEHFGQPLRGPLLRDRQPSGRVRNFTVDGPVVFNPEDEGVGWPNRSRHTFARQAHYFSDPRSRRSPAASAWQQEPAVYQEWDLAHAVHTLCWLLNGEEIWIANPAGTHNDLRRLFGSVPLKNVAVPRFTFLPQVLDQLLAPLGFGWYLEIHAGRPRIAFYKIGASHQLVELKHQRSNASLSLVLTNVEECSLGYAIDRNLVNQLAAVSHPVQVEAVFELVKGWAPAHDNLTEEDLTRGMNGLLNNPAYHNVWRRWVLNEAGDYVGLRPEIARPFDWSTIKAKVGRAFGAQVQVAKYFAVRRRRFLPLLALESDGKAAGQVLGVRVQWFNGSTWKEVEALNEVGRHFELLDDECGIWFSGIKVPYEIKLLATAAKVRVIATVEADAGELYAVDNSQRSVNRAFTAPTLLDGREKYNVRVIDVSSDYYDDVNNGMRRSLEVNELSAMKTQVDQLADRWNRADCGGGVSLPGLQHDGLELGSLVSGIAGRNLRLYTHHQDNRYPQIVALDYDAVSQQIHLQLDTPRDSFAF